MNEQTYIDLYKEAASIIKAKSSTLLNEGRDEAFALFTSLGFPSNKEEAYKYSRLNDTLSIDYGLNLNRLTIPMDPGEVLKCDVPGIKAYLYYVVNDILYTAPGEQNTLPDGVIMCRLSEACLKYPELVKSHLGKEIEGHKDGYVAFNQAFAQDGFFLYVPKNVEIEMPIQIINMMRSSVDTMIEARNLIVMEPGSKAKVIVCEHCMDPVAFFTHRVSEVQVKRNAQFEYYSLESTHERTYNLSQVFINQEEDSRVITNLIGLNNGETRNHIEINLNGEGAETWIGGMLVSDRKQMSDNYTIIRHNAAHCKSQEMFKYILDEEAVGAFSGLVLVAPHAQKTEAYQTNRNICLTREAHMYARPQLEIYADDVKCGHGATTGQLDETALFYMQTRGIGAVEARMLLLLAFTADIIDHVSVEALRDRLRTLVEKRLRGERSHCQNCSICN